jgi:hypothetical protein
LGRVPRGHTTGMRAAPAAGGSLRRKRPTFGGRSWRARGAVLAGLGLWVGLLSGCGGGDDRPAAADEAQSTTTTAAPAETTTTLSATQREEQAVRDAHAAASQARRDSSAPPEPDPQSPALRATHTGQMLEYWTETIRALQYNGFAIRYPPNSQYREEIESISFDEENGQQIAQVELCVVDDGERISVATGNVQSSGVFTVEATETMRKEGGVWKVEALREDGASEGVVGCAVD